MPYSVGSAGSGGHRFSTAVHRDGECRRRHRADCRCHGSSVATAYLSVASGAGAIPVGRAPQSVPKGSLSLITSRPTGSTNPVFCCLKILLMVQRSEAEVATFIRRRAGAPPPVRQVVDDRLGDPSPSHPLHCGAAPRRAPRFCRHMSRPHQQGCEGGCAWWTRSLVVPGGDAAPLLQLVEAPFHHVAPLVGVAVEGRGPSTTAAPGPILGTRIACGTAMNWVQSLVLPPVAVKGSGRPAPSQARWILFEDGP